MPKVSQQSMKSKPTAKASSRPAERTGPESVIDRIKSIGFTEDDGIKMLLYGQSGSGKTTTWATFPKKILAIICSSVARPGELRSIDTAEYRDEIDEVVLTNTLEMRDLLDYIPSAGYSTVVLDHASGFQDLVLKEILGLDELPAQKSWGMASQQQYGQCTTKAKEYFRALLNLPCNVVITAQEKEAKMDVDSELIAPTVGANLMPSLAGWLYPAVDYIVQTYKRRKVEEVTTTIAGKPMKTKVTTKEVEYCLRTGPDAVYTTKFRVPKGPPLPDAIVDPTYAKIMDLIKGRTEDE